MVGPLCGAIRRHVDDAPDAPALDDALGIVTYAELWSLAEKVRDQLVDGGVPSRSLVGVDVGNRGAFPAAALGVMLHGCAYVPLDPAYPAARRSFIARDAGISGALVDAGGRSVSYRPGPEGAGRLVPHPHPAYLIYTSGTTGTPKGILITQEQVWTLLETASPLFGVGPGDVWSVFHSFNFDFSVWELWGALRTGGRAVIVEADARRDGELLVERLRNARVTLLSMVPTAFKYLLCDGSAAQLPDLRWLVLGGESVDVPRTLDWIGDRSGATAVNMYGLTESTVHATHLVLTPGSAPARPGSTPIGRPLAHLQVDVVDDSLGSCPPGVVGELVISGSAVANGYWRRPDLTAARFVSRDGVPTYRTGDLAFRDAAGLLHHLGRSDDQVQVRGFRIEPAEISAAASAHPDVADAITVPFTNAAGDLDLVCHYRTRPGAQPFDLRVWLGQRLPPHLIPARIVEHATFPLTPEGKVDRGELARRVGAR